MDDSRKRARVARNTANTTGKPSAVAKAPSSSSSEEASMDERIALLRRNAPVLYDSFLHHNLQWGSLSVAWGSEVESANRVMVDANTYPEEFNVEQTLYFSGRTDGVFDHDARTWSGSPGELFVGRVALPKPRTVPRTSIGKFQENNRSSRVGVVKRLIHPGEVNRIRAFPLAPHMIATHTDSPTVFIWNTVTQPNRLENLSDDTKVIDKDNKSSMGASTNTTSSSTSTTGGGRKKSGSWIDPCRCSVPDLELVGHKQLAEYALDTKGDSKVLSGGSDKLVLLWSLQDGANEKNQVQPRMVFEGHTAPVEDCSFRPNNAGEDRCCSVGQDRFLLLWDARSPKYSERCPDTHSADANCCAWNVNDLILTGGSDCVVNVFDIRKLDLPLTYVEQKSSIINVRWSPDDPHVFAVTDEAANLTLYKLDAGGVRKADVFFQHLGHRTSVVDLQFNPSQPWTMASVSDDSADEARGGGGTLQIWRVNEFVHRTMQDKEWVNDVLSKTATGVSPPGNTSEEESSEE